MYVIQKSRTISDTIVLEDGEKSLKIEFSLDPTAIASSYWRLAGSLYFDREKVRKDPSPENLEALGKSFEALMQIIFNAENSKKIIDFYEGNYFHLLEDIYPYLVNEIFPKLREASRKKAKELKRIR